MQRVITTGCIIKIKKKKKGHIFFLTLIDKVCELSINYAAKISVFHLTCKSQLLTNGIILTVEASLIHLIFTFTDYQLNRLINRLKISFQH